MPVVDMFAHDLLFAPLVTLLANSRHVVVFAYSDWSFSSTWTPCGSIAFFFYFWFGFTFILRSEGMLRGWMMWIKVFQLSDL